jgi:hypothetical protein
MGDRDGVDTSGQWPSLRAERVGRRGAPRARAIRDATPDLRGRIANTGAARRDRVRRGGCGQARHAMRPLFPSFRGAPGDPPHPERCPRRATCGVRLSLSRALPPQYDCDVRLVLDPDLAPRRATCDVRFPLGRWSVLVRKYYVKMRIRHLAGIAGRTAVADTALAVSCIPSRNRREGPVARALSCLPVMA